MHTWPETIYSLGALADNDLITGVKNGGLGNNGSVEFTGSGYFYLQTTSSSSAIAAEVDEGTDTNYIMYGPTSPFPFKKSVRIYTDRYSTGTYWVIFTNKPTQEEGD